MKRKNHSIFSLLLLFMLSMYMFVGCQLFTPKQEDGGVKATVVSATESLLVIKVEEAETEATLLSVMQTLQEEGKISFVIEGGMVTEINGVANTANYNPCWMLYTSDAELSNTAWGTVEFNNQTYGSAVVGAESLTVIAEGYYIWSYQSF